MPGLGGFADHPATFCEAMALIEGWSAEREKRMFDDQKRKADAAGRKGNAEPTKRAATKKK